MVMRNRTEEEGDDTLSEIVHTIENSLDRKLDIGGLACTVYFCVTLIGSSKALPCTLYQGRTSMAIYTSAKPQSHYYGC